MPTRAAIGLGSNLGDRERHLRTATQELGRLGSVVAVSSTYETAPLGGPPQGPYLNSVVLVDTDLGPAELLEALLGIERAAGRERRVRWGPRTLDLDILLYGDRTVSRPGLQIPHPELTKRRFALAPLLEVWPEAELPGGTPLAPFLEGVADQDVAVVAGPEGRVVFPPWAAIALFLLVGLGAVVLWWLMDLVL